MANRLTNWYWFFRPSLSVMACYLLAVTGGVGYLYFAEDQTVLRRSPVATAAQIPVLKELKQPRPGLTPADVVRIQLEGLAADTQGMTGIAQCMLFASPANLAATGPLPKFAAMVRSPPYQLLGMADGIVIGEPLEHGATARMLVVALRGSELQSYVWVLGKQPQGPHAGCWMTESVLIEPALHLD